MSHPKVYVICFLVSLTSQAFERPALPHLDLQMSGSEYYGMMKNRDDGEGNHELDPVIRMGNRLFKWLKLINHKRPEEKKLSLSAPENQPGYPIESPKVSSPKIILNQFKQLRVELPAPIAKEVFGNHELTDLCSMSDEDFVLWGRRIDNLYGAASRWLLQEPMLWGYAAKRRSDIRGYYLLTHTPNIETVLARWKDLDDEHKNKLRVALKGLCQNSGETDTICEGGLSETEQTEKTPLKYFNTYLPHGKARWDELFMITQKREDIEWNSSSESLLYTPFEKPDSEEVFSFLKENIEDEWRWSGWALKLNFIKGDWNTTHVEFIPGATPHVNGLAGSTITMDANQPLTEYHVRWTIRHEFGHTLGFPDCYVEFYEPNQHEMISYQVDTTNLMCSRRGKLQEKHFLELKRVYYQ